MKSVLFILAVVDCLFAVNVCGVLWWSGASTNSIFPLVMGLLLLVNSVAAFVATISRDEE